MEQFLTSPFNTTPINPVNFEKRPDDLCPDDINPYNTPGKNHFESVLHARYEKMLHFMNISQLAGGFEVIQHEHVLEPQGQIAWVSSLKKRWNLPLKNDNAIVPIVGDARPWKQTNESTYYNAQRRIARSIYLNKNLVNEDEQEKKMCQVKNNHLNEYFEQLMGYQVLDCNIAQSTEQHQ